jgi:hypothetical protein
MRRRQSLHMLWPQASLAARDRGMSSARQVRHSTSRSGGRAEGGGGLNREEKNPLFRRLVLVAWLGASVRGSMPEGSACCERFVMARPRLVVALRLRGGREGIEIGTSRKEALL